MTKSYNPFLTLLFVGLLIAACSNEQQVQTQFPIDLEPVRSLSEINDTTFFANIGVMKSANNHLYLSDNSNQVFMLGSDLDLLWRFAKNGNGPGEFTGASDMSIVNDSLYLYDRLLSKILVFDPNNNFVREVILPVASGFNMVVDDKSQIYLSTPYRERGLSITKFSENGQEIMAFGNNLAGADYSKPSRNTRFLFVHDDQLITVAKSEPVLEIYSLEGAFIDSASIAFPELQEFIERVKEDNEDPNSRGLSLLFIDAAIYNNNLFLLEAKHTNESTNTYDTNFTYLFKYTFEPNGEVIHEQTFELYRTDREELMYGFRLEVIKEHKLAVFDLMGGNLLVYEDERL